MAPRFAPLDGRRNKLVFVLDELFASSCPKLTEPVASNYDL